MEKNNSNSKNGNSSDFKNPVSPQEKKAKKQNKKELLANALRDNLRRRKSAAANNDGE